MPWCDDCDRFYNPTSMGAGGECPSCGRTIAAPAKLPWHFKVLVGSAVIYLGWRGLQGVAWLLDRFA